MMKVTLVENFSSKPITIGTNAQWIWEHTESQPDSWCCFRQQFQLLDKPAKAITHIAADSKYWLWINGTLVVREGGLKRGPTPNDTYVDEVDLSSHLQKGQNTIAILVWYFGQNGSSHHSSGKGALLFSGDWSENQIVSNSKWRVIRHPAFGKLDE